MLTCLCSLFVKTAAFAKVYPALGSADSFNLFVSASNMLLSRPRGNQAKDDSTGYGVWSMEMFRAVATADPQGTKPEIRLTMLFTDPGRDGSASARSARRVSYTSSV